MLLANAPLCRAIYFNKHQIIVNCKKILLSKPFFRVELDLVSTSNTVTMYIYDKQIHLYVYVMEIDIPQG